MHDLLVSYLLGESTDQEREFVEQKLRDDPEVCRQLAMLRHCMGLDSAAGATCPEPPPDLASRTSKRVATVADSGEYPSPGATDAAFSSLGFASSASESESGNSSWTVADLTVAAGVVLAIGMLLLPALRDSHCASRRIECQDNLRQLGVALANYSADHQRYMPLVRPDEHSGMFALLLVDQGYLDRGSISEVLVCPSSELANRIRNGKLSYHMPTLQEFNSSRGPQRMTYLRTTGGSYAYRFGYVDDGEYRTLRDTYCPYTPLLSDSPTTTRVDFTSCNHGGCGQNMLYQDKRVVYQVGYTTPTGSDHLFLNKDGFVAPSDDPADTVLARSEAQPQILSRDKAQPTRIQVVPRRSP